MTVRMKAQQSLGPASRLTPDPRPQEGRPLPEEVRQIAEDLFGMDLSQVRVHISGGIRHRRLRAFTAGSDIYFTPGQYNPSSEQGLKLLGHELAHVVQQKTGLAHNHHGYGAIVVRNAGLEHDAERMGARLAGRLMVASRQATGPQAHGHAVQPMMGGKEFPHKGKHRPPLDQKGNIKDIIGLTEKKGQPALYITASPDTVLGWEQTAREKGYHLLCDGFTVIHRFTDVIGADQGEYTRCVRIDGDHGHPIIEDGGKTSFYGYVRREIEFIKELQGEKKSEQLEKLSGYLEGVGLDPRVFGLEPIKEPEQVQEQVQEQDWNDPEPWKKYPPKKKK